MSSLSFFEKAFAIPPRREEVPFQNIERADCAVRAVTAVTNIPYDTVHEQFAKGGRKSRGRSANGLAEKICVRLGFVLEPWEVTAKTIRTLERELPAKGHFLIEVRGHMLAVINGKTVDWSAGRQHHIQNVWRVTPQ